jgi:hypothetical protein
MHASHPRPIRRLALLCAVSLLVLLEPALANKFETIGGGVSGSVAIKREWLQGFFLVAGGLSLLGMVLAIAVPHRNALLLNYNNWKQSAVVLGLLALAFFGVAFVV